MKTTLALAILTATMAAPLSATAGHCGSKDGYMKHGYTKHGYMPRHGYSRPGYGQQAYRDHGYRGYGRPMPMTGYRPGGGYKGGYQGGYADSGYGGGDQAGSGYERMSGEQYSAPSGPDAGASGVAEDVSAANDVDISGMRFEPASLTVAAGEVVIWTNNSSGMPHTVTGNGNQLASSRLNQGSTFEFKFDEPGTYEYYCALHPSMTGTIVVQ